jgi:hypothetical protein
MAKAVIAEYAIVGNSKDAVRIPVANNMLLSQAVTFTTSTQSAAFSSSTRFIRIISDGKTHFAIGENPTADADSPWIAADSPEYFGVRSNEKIALFAG